MAAAAATAAMAAVGAWCSRPDRARLPPFAPPRGCEETSKHTCMQGAPPFHTHIYVYMYVCMYACMYVRTCVLYIYIYTYVYTHTEPDIEISPSLRLQTKFKMVTEKSALSVRGVGGQCQGESIPWVAQSQQRKSQFLPRPFFRKFVCIRIYIYI